MKALLATLLPILALGLTAAPTDAQDPPAAPAPIQEEGDFYVLHFSESQDEALTLEDFVKLCQEATGRNFTYAKETAQSLKSLSVVMLGAKRIPKADFYLYFQIQMFINEFICIEVGPPHIRLILIQSISTPGRGASARPAQRALYVGPDQLEDYEDSPATLVTTVLNLPNTDVRQLSTSMRTMFADQQTQQMIPAGEHSVILTGFGSQIAAIARLLMLVDEESAVEDMEQPLFDVVPLEYAAAEDVAELIEQLIEAQQRNTPGANVRRDGQQGVSGALLGGQMEPKVLVDYRTNSLLIMALPDELPAIKDLVARLDVDVLEPERNFHIYNLQNMVAEDLADVLDEFLSGAERLDTAQNRTGGRAGGGAQAGGGSSRTSNEVIVVPDENANALLIGANKTRYEEVLELIRQLDRRQDQVLIETALIELTGTDFRDIGVELAFADVTDDGGFGITNFGLSTITDSDADGVPDLRVPDSTLSGLVGGILSGDDLNLPFLINAAQRTDGADVLNVPSVLVNNNGSAKVTTKDEQPTTTITVGSGVGGQTQENFRQYEEAGITLEISPSISASNYLRLDVSLVVQTFAGAFEAGSAIPPPRITREIHTTVNVPDGDTMVIGGIITDDRTKTRRAIPWLGDLPLLGYFFSRETTNNTRRTLYFFVTPHILKDRDFADLAEISYQKKIEAARTIGRERVQVIDPDFQMDEDRLDESFQIPLYRAPERGEMSDQEIGLDPQRKAELMRKARQEKEAAGAEAPAEPPAPENGPASDDGTEANAKNS